MGKYQIFNARAARTERFQSSFVPYCICKWNQLGPEVQNSVSLLSFKHSLSLFIRPAASPIYTIHHIRGLKLLTRLRVGLSHLREYKFHHNSHDYYYYYYYYIIFIQAESVNVIKTLL